MVPILPAFVVRFDIDKVNAASYGRACWKIFWRAIQPETIAGAFLFEGDSDATLRDRERVYLLALQGIDSQVFGRVKAELSKSVEFNRVGAKPLFAEGMQVTKEPLVEAGRMDRQGNLLGYKAMRSRPALGEVRRERCGAPPIPVLPTKIPPRIRPASERTRNLPPLKTFDDLKTLLQKSFTHVKYDLSCWLTAGELCDLVETYQELVEVEWNEYSEQRSEDVLSIGVYEKSPAGTKAWSIGFQGLFAFAAESDVGEHLPNYGGAYDGEYASALKTLAGITGRFQLNFEGQGLGRSYGKPESLLSAERLLPADKLWLALSARSQRLGIQLPGSRSDAGAKPAAKPTVGSPAGSPSAKQPGSAPEKIRFHCPYCNKSVGVAVQYAGKKGKCPGCGAVIEIPDAEPVKQVVPATFEEPAIYGLAPTDAVDVVDDGEEDAWGPIWEATGYRTLPRALLVDLQGARRHAKARQWQEAIQLLESILQAWAQRFPQANDYLARRPLALCLHAQAIEKLDRSLEKAKGSWPLLDQLIQRADLRDEDLSETEEFIIRKIAVGEVDIHDVLEAYKDANPRFVDELNSRSGNHLCVLCFGFIIGSYRQFKHLDMTCALCPSCGDPVREEKRAKERKLGKVLERCRVSLSRAQELDPYLKRVQNALGRIDQETANLG